MIRLFYFMTGDVKKFGGSIKDLYKKFMGEDLFYRSFKISDIKKLLGVGENLKWEMTKCLKMSKVPIKKS